MMMTGARTIASGWRVVDPQSDDLCSGGGQILAPLTFSDGSPMRPLSSSPGDCVDCPSCGRMIAVIADFDGDSIAPHRMGTCEPVQASAGLGQQLGMFQDG